MHQPQKVLHNAHSLISCECLSTTLKIRNEDIPFIFNSEEKSFLGKPFGFQFAQHLSDLNSYIESANLIIDSPLA